MTFDKFKERIDRDLYPHPVIQNNPYTKWFKLGQANDEQVKDLLIQFSFFSLQFKAIQAQRMANADSIEAEEEAYGILVSELGGDQNVWKPTGGKISRKNSHIEWLRDTAEVLDIPREILGRRRFASEPTKQFIIGMRNILGNDDGNIGGGGSFSTEACWAGFGIGKGTEMESNNFWKELIVGIEKYNDRRLAQGLKKLKPDFFIHHFEIEIEHAKSVERELEKTYSNPEFSGRKWFYGARKALDAIYIFWNGLDEARKRLER